jgi:hypothetical protein
MYAFQVIIKILGALCDHFEMSFRHDRVLAILGIEFRKGHGTLESVADLPPIPRATTHILTFIPAGFSKVQDGVIIEEHVWFGHTGPA